MRSLALAGIVLLLAGCSLPYEGTSFKSTPKFETAKEHEGGEAGAESSRVESTTVQSHRPDEEGSAPAAGATAPASMGAQNGDDTYPDAPSNPRTYVKNGSSRVSAVFPTTAQPSR